MKDHRFAYAEGTTFAAVENAAPTSMYITDVNRLMLVVVNRFLLLTADQLTGCLLNTLHLEGMNGADLGKQICLMTRANFLTKYVFRDSEARVLFPVYGLGYRGRGLLKSMNEAPRMAGFVAQLEACRAMKLLSSNQYLIESAASVKTLQTAKTIYTHDKNLRKRQRIARPHGLVQTDAGTQLVESVRREADYLEQLEEKLSRLQLLLDREDLNVQISRPTLLLICEDDEILNEVRACLSGKKYCFDILGTTDGETAADRLHPIVQASKKRFWDRLCSRLFRAA